MLKPLVPVVALALLLAGCSAPAEDDGLIHVVASTNVYGDIAQTIGGDRVEVTSIIDDPSQDPHQFEANGRVQLALSRADVVIVNGGGYDDFATQMLEASGNDDARVIDAVDLSGYDAGADGFNEHVWYDYPTMITVVKAIGAAFDIADPDGAADFDGGTTSLVTEIEALQQFELSIETTAAGAGAVITEPVPLYALQASGFTNLTPPAFSEAIEEDTDVPPALLQDVLNLIGDGSARVVVYNAQTGGPQTDAIIDVATDARVPIIAVTETLPDGQHYLDWQKDFLVALQDALFS